jgi:hypothetical protein
VQLVAVPPTGLHFAVVVAAGVAYDLETTLETLAWRAGEVGAAQLAIAANA